MVSLLHEIRFIVLFLIFNLTIQSSTSSPLENDKLAQLIERLDRMQTEMDGMRSSEVENAQLTERLDRMQTKIDAMRSREEVLEAENAKLTERLDRIRIRVEVLEVENDKWTRKFDDLKAENEKLKNQISHPKFSLSAPKRYDGPSSRVLSSPPTSCQELKNQNGLWPMDGIHLLKKQNKIKVAFCTFAADGSPVSEILLGQVSVKSKIVHFYVQRNSSFSTINAVIPFDVARLNEGGAFNVPSGIFTAPVPGIYNFYLSAVKTAYVTNLDILLQVNGANVGLASTNHGYTGTWEAVSLSASLRLAAGDKVNLFHFYDFAYTHSSELADNEKHYTHFSGSLVEEELN